MGFKRAMVSNDGKLPQPLRAGDGLLANFELTAFAAETDADLTVAQVAVEVDPLALRKTILAFRISDGLIPSTKIINADTLSIAIQTIGNSPQIGAGYNIAPMFSYLIKTQGADIAPFEKSPEQIAYEQALQLWQQAIMVFAEKGIEPKKLGPQPTPQQFGYQPAQQPQPKGNPNE